MRIPFAGNCRNRRDNPQKFGGLKKKGCPDRHSFECLSGQCLRNPSPHGRGPLLWQARRHGSITISLLS